MVKTNFEDALHRKAYDLVFDHDGFRISALILETATNEELTELQTIARHIAERYTAEKAVER